MRLESKTIVLTGGTSGIGLEILKRLSEKNKVIVLARNTAKLKSLNLQIENIDLIDCDLAKVELLDEVVDEIIKKYNYVDVLINNAAVQFTPCFLDDDFAVESIDREIKINFSSVCRLIYLLLPALIKDSRSIILNVNSGLALSPKTTSAVYCASKAALNSFSISLGYQLEKTNIRVQQIFMPLVDTPMTKGRGSGKISPAIAASEVIEGIEKESPVVNVGKVKLLRFLLKLSPWVANRIMKRG